MEEYIGIIKLFAGSFAPRGWAICNGARLEVSRFQALYSVLGDTYGGDGATFNLPDFRGRVPLGVDPIAQPIEYYMGCIGGKPSVNLDTTQLPVHTHGTTVTSAINASSQHATESAIVTDLSVIAAPGKGGGRDFDASFGFNQEVPDVKLAPASTTVTVKIEAAGGGAAVDVRQPFMGMNYIICMEGVYPSRG
jgi:microcystin-dependent protein